MLKAPVNKIIPFSNVDGPGNRCAIFFQKCPFHCLYCHNPETINECINCGACVKTCPTNALIIEKGKVKWIKDKCVGCDTCIKTCTHLSSPKITFYTPKKLFEEISGTIDYIEGVTVSGGECMEHADFLTEFFRLCKKAKLTTFIDSNGFYDFSKYPELLKVCDSVMLDVKAADDNYHKKICGPTNKQVLSNLKYLQKNKKLYEVRTVILPNENEQNKKTVTYVSNTLDTNIRYKLIKYRPFGVREEGLKYLGNQITTDKEIEKMANIAKKAGLRHIVTV